MIPHNEELERMMIGLVLVDKTVPYDAKQLSTIDFYIGQNRAIWAAICEMDESREPIDIASLHSKLSNWPIKMADLAQMTLGVPIHAECAKEVKTLQRLTALRTLQKGFHELAEKAEKQEPLEGIVEQVESLMTGVKEMQNASQGTSRILAEVYERDVFPRLDKYVSGELVKLPFGWDVLDKSTNGGSSLGELVVLGAKPKSGKSGLMLQIARTQAERNIGCYVCSREMLNYENGFRAIAQTSPYSANVFRAGIFPETAARIKEHAKQMGSIPLHLDDKAKTVKEIRKELNRLEDLGHVITSTFVDYVQLMRGVTKTNSKADMLEDIIYDLKDLAMERDMVVYANAQFNREGIDSDRPKMSDFKGSSAIEMAANIVLLWTLDQDVDASLRARKGKLWIEAGRNVAFDEFDVRFFGEKALFELL